MMRVVIVDDEMITRTSLKDFICSQLSDYEVAGTFSNGQEALLYPSGSWIENEMKDQTKAGFEMTGAPVPVVSASPKIAPRPTPPRSGKRRNTGPGKAVR